MRSKADEMASLTYSARPRNEKIRKNVKQKPCSSEETVQAIIRRDSPGERSETTGEGLGCVKEVGFKPGVKERGSYRCTEW